MNTSNQNSAHVAYENWAVTTATINGCVWEDPPPRCLPGSLFVGYFRVAFTYAINGKNYCGSFDSPHMWARDTEVGLLCNPEDPLDCCICDDDEPLIIRILGGVLESLDLS
ncbi:hypothetical protein DYQ86_16875 [Acidobacteria bacterium AB60]|nr:hypothetical protein DYQ86_16875 [Acidobacteria bacterium AB60]